MGTDIHMAVQLRSVTGYRRNDRTIRNLQREASLGAPAAIAELEELEIRDGDWEVVACEWWAGTEPVPKGWIVHEFPLPWDTEYKENVLSKLTVLPQPWWEYRSYETFYRLAGIRNGGYDVEPIAQPRGYPSGFKLPGVDQDLGWHSQSWLTATEILNYDGWYPTYEESGNIWTGAREWCFLNMVQAWVSRFGLEVRFVFGFDS